MPIKRSSDQPSMTLEEFYIDLSETSTNHYKDVGLEMLRFVQLINGMFKETLIYGLISHARLVLQNVDDWKFPWYVIVSNLGSDYYFEYLLPSDKQPWENAYVSGKANTIEEAKMYLLIAMNECGGWADNSELKQLMILHGIG